MYTLKSKQGKVLCTCSTLQDLSDMQEFYERNEPSYAPCYGVNLSTGEILSPIIKTKKTGGTKIMKTKKLYYVVNNDTITRVSPLCTNKREVEKVCRDANKRYPFLFLVSWEWDDANGRAELAKLDFKPVYLF